MILGIAACLAWGVSYTGTRTAHWLGRAGVQTQAATRRESSTIRRAAIGHAAPAGMHNGQR